jgi:hypothetical protein
MPRKRLKVKERRLHGIFPYPTPEQRTPEQQTAVADYVAGRSDVRPDFIDYPENDPRRFFGPDLLTASEYNTIARRAWEEDCAEADDVA